MNAEPRRGQLCFLAAAAQLHFEAKVACRATESQLIHHPVGSALQLIGLPDYSNSFRQIGEWRLANRERDDGIRRRQARDDFA